ncbi:M15 family metallopeptidase [Cellulomonas cellasea]|uniref:LAS superfamily LD-carboxypeptidase LdcB n=1 Tax=Cellulomonas cellasea TaxID=43670 RepID=A0A7W4YCV1_9CELL|nr:M15 family metallopeptidase [Cellulomonas cellasea]MBB2924052.1 LAS superfamily LD-carboxypeptidase LdcB [Cellulomonas cellasea]
MTGVPRATPVRRAARPAAAGSPAASAAALAGLHGVGPRTRAGVLAALVVLVLAGGGWGWFPQPAEAGAGEAASVTAARPADVRAADAQTARLTAQGAAHARAEHARARATALATLESVENASVTAWPGVDPQLVARLDAAVAHLARTLRTTAEAPDPALLRTRAGRAATRVPGGGAVAVSSDAVTPASAGAPVAGPGTPDTLERRAGTPALTRRVEAAAERVALLRSVVEAAARDAAARLDALDALLARAQAPAALQAPGSATASSGTYVPGGIDPSGDPYPNGAIPPHTLCRLASDARALLRCDAAAAFDRLAAAYERDLGEPLRVTDSYRTLAAQVAVKAAKPGLAATPGRSNHGRGVAVDLAGFGGVGQFDRPGYLWMKAHAAEHGWFHPHWAGPGGVGPAEPWHWEYGGAPGGVFAALRPSRAPDVPVAPPAPAAPAPAAPAPGVPTGPVPAPVGPAAPAPGPTPGTSEPVTPDPAPTSGPPADPGTPEPEPEPAEPPADAPADAPPAGEGPADEAQPDAAVLTEPAPAAEAGAG